MNNGCGHSQVPLQPHFAKLQCRGGVHRHLLLSRLLLVLPVHYRSGSLENPAVPFSGLKQSWWDFLLQLRTTTRLNQLVKRKTALMPQTRDYSDSYSNERPKLLHQAKVGSTLIGSDLVGKK